MNPTKITILVDNHAEAPLQAEHGFSVLIEQHGKRILFDTGQNEALFHNAKELNISLENIDYLILSHGHYDHGGNIAPILKQNPHITFVAHPSCTIPRYSLHEGKPVKSVALTTENKQAIINLSHEQHRWCFHEEKVVDGLWVTGKIPRLTSFEDTGGPFFLDPNKNKADLLPDDIALWIENDEGCTVICGCCHAGLVNTLEFISSKTDKPIHTVIGGFHLLYADENRMNQTIDYLNTSTIKTIYPSHCTGDTAIALLKNNLLAEVILGEAGLQR